MFSGDPVDAILDLVAEHQPTGGRPARQWTPIS
jgi:hypothetical protein